MALLEVMKKNECSRKEGVAREIAYNLPKEKKILLANPFITEEVVINC